MGWRIHGESSSLQDAWSQQILLEQNGRSTLFVSKEESFSHHWRSTMATKSTCLLLGAKISKESKKIRCFYSSCCGVYAKYFAGTKATKNERNAGSDKARNSLLALGSSL